MVSPQELAPLEQSVPPATLGETAWRVRALRATDIPGVLDLFHEAFGKLVPEELYRWKVLGSAWPDGPSTVWLASVGERIVGHYGGTPLRFQLGTRELRALHGCDVMTARDFRRQGVLTAIGDSAHAAWAADGIAFVIGLPTEAWGSRRQRLGCQDAFPLHWLRRPLRPESLLARRLPRHALALWTVARAVRLWNHACDSRLRSAARGVEIVPIQWPDTEFDVLWDRLRGEYDALVVRDRAWVAYRYADAPGYAYRLLLARRGGLATGYLVYRITSVADRTTGWIADLFSAPGDPFTRAALLRAAIERLDAAGAEEIRTLAPPGTPLSRSLRRAGFLGRAGAYDLIVIPLADEVPRSLLRDPTRWLASGGDFDVL